jgi:hypothetical protein
MFSFLVVRARIDCSAHLPVPVELVRFGILTEAMDRNQAQRQVGTLECHSRVSPVPSQTTLV